MTEKKYITGADALRALADGKIVRLPGFPALDAETCEIAVSEILRYTGWEIVEEPATDEELVAWMRRAAKEDVSILARQAYALCADMLEKRKAKP